MTEDLKKLMEDLGIDIDSEITSVDVSVFCSPVTEELLTCRELCDIIKV